MILVFLSLSLSLSLPLSHFLSPPCCSLPPIVPSFQANLNRLEQVEGENTELAALVEEGRRQCQQLTSSIEKQEKEVGWSGYEKFVVHRHK